MKVGGNRSAGGGRKDGGGRKGGGRKEGRDTGYRFLNNIYIILFRSQDSPFKKKISVVIAMVGSWVVPLGRFFFCFFSKELVKK